MDPKNYFDFDEEMDSVLESTLSLALEAEGHVIDPKTRDSLPDNAFGVVYTSETEKDKNGNQFAYLDLYTPFGIIEATIWSSQLKEYSDNVKKGNCLAILGRKREEHFFVEKIKPYNTWLEQMRKKGVAV